MAFVGGFQEDKNSYAIFDLVVNWQNVNGDETQPNRVLVGGPNGAGKTTLVMEALTEFDFEYLGADKIAYEMCPEDVASVAVKAGREFFDSNPESPRKSEINHRRIDSLRTRLSSRSLAVPRCGLFRSNVFRIDPFGQSQCRAGSDSDSGEKRRPRCSY